MINSQDIRNQPFHLRFTCKFELVEPEEEVQHLHQVVGATLGQPSLGMDAGGRRQEAGGRRQEAGGRRQEAGFVTLMCAH